MCQKDVNSPTGTSDTYRNGVKTQTQNYNKPQSLKETKAARDKRKTDAVDQTKVLQESWDWYDKCYVRERNKGKLKLWLNDIIYIFSSNILSLFKIFYSLIFKP